MINIQTKKRMTKKDQNIELYFLGGLEEVGRNMMVVSYENEIIIIDMGLQFPDENMPGIDYIIPNIESLVRRKKDIKAIIITHAHYDHIGGIPHLIPILGERIPVYGTDLTLAIIEKRQEDFKDKPMRLNLKEITTDSVLNIGSFKIEFFGVSHNIPGSLGVIIHTPHGILVHTGDFKIDTQSDIAGRTEIEKIEALGKKNILALLSDSTNASEPGSQFSELEIKLQLDDVIAQAKGRIIVGTFASLIGRLNQIIQIGEKYGRKIAIDGRSMKTNVEIASRLGYMKYDPKNIIPVERVDDFPKEKVMILVTGAQGEERAVLMRLVNREHRTLKLDSGDTVILSSSIIPGNEQAVQNLTDELYRSGADVLNYRMLDIHAGGHAKQEDLKKLIKLVNPKYLVPIQGHHSFLKMHAKIAAADGFPAKNIIIADNGQVIEIQDQKMILTNRKMPANYVFVDGLGIGDVQEVVLRDRRVLSEDGIFVIIAVVDSQTGKVRGSPDIISRGFVYLKESRGLLSDTRKLVRHVIEKTTSEMHPINWTYVKDSVKEKLGSFLYKKTRRRPMVLPVIIEV